MVKKASTEQPVKEEPKPQPKQKTVQQLYDEQIQFYKISLGIPRMKGMLLKRNLKG